MIPLKWAQTLKNQHKIFPWILKVQTNLTSKWYMELGHLAITKMTSNYSTLNTVQIAAQKTYQWTNPVNGTTKLVKTKWKAC